MQMKNLMGVFCAAVVAIAAVLPRMAMGVEISKVREGKLAALSFTYDDAARSHYDAALPLHLKYKLPATFLVITDRADEETKNPTGKPLVPNANHAVCVQTGDTIVVGK